MAMDLNLTTHPGSGLERFARIKEMVPLEESTQLVLPSATLSDNASRLYSGRVILNLGKIQLDAIDLTLISVALGPISAISVVGFNLRGDYQILAGWAAVDVEVIFATSFDNAGH